MTRAVAGRLLHIREAARDVVDIAGAMEDDALHALPHADHMADRALKNALSEPGAAVQALPRKVTDRHASVDWRGFAGLRDIVPHDCFGLRQDLL